MTWLLTFKHPYKIKHEQILEYSRPLFHQSPSQPPRFAKSPTRRGPNISSRITSRIWPHEEPWAACLLLGVTWRWGFVSGLVFLRFLRGCRKQWFFFFLVMVLWWLAWLFGFEIVLAVHCVNIVNIFLDWFSAICLLGSKVAWVVACKNWAILRSTQGLSSTGYNQQ